MENQPSANLGNVPHPSETYGTIPNPSEPFRTIRNHSERTENHTLTVREVARKFEEGGVPRTERSVTNWCQPNRQGVARLDAFFDENEGRYYVTPESVTRAIEEERAKQTAPSKSATSDIPSANRSEARDEEFPKSEKSPLDPELEFTVRDLEITNRMKDRYIERLEADRERFDAERQRYIGQLIGMSREIGELESRVQQLGSGNRFEHSLPKPSEDLGGISESRRTGEEIFPKEGNDGPAE
jgi:hypothetical protein